jgi:hypothetical protein
VEADALAKEGADQVPVDEESYFRFAMRKWLNSTVQNYLVDVWSSEEKRMYGTEDKKKIINAEVKAVHYIESIGNESEEALFPDEEDDI